MGANRTSVPAVAPKIRVIASREPRSPLPYRAEVYDDQDRFGEPWICAHEHKSVEDALRCGNEWLAERGGDLAVPP